MNRRGFFAAALGAPMAAKAARTKFTGTYVINATVTPGIDVPKFNTLEIGAMEVVVSQPTGAKWLRYCDSSGRRLLSVPVI